MALGGELRARNARARKMFHNDAITAAFREPADEAQNAHTPCFKSDDLCASLIGSPAAK